MLTYPNKVSNGGRGLNFDLYLHPYFVYEGSEGSGKSAHLHSNINKASKSHVLTAGSYYILAFIML